LNIQSKIIGIVDLNRT